MQSVYLITLCVLVYVTLHCVKGNCIYTPVRMVRSHVGTNHYYCDYNITRNNATVTLSVIPGSEFRTKDCMECQCARAGLRCCGFGIKARSPSYIPSACKVVADGCEPVVVLKSNNATDCYTGQPVGFSRQQKMFNLNLMKTLASAQNGNANGRGMTEEAMDNMMQYMMIAPLLSSFESSVASTSTSGYGPTAPRYGSPMGGLGPTAPRYGSPMEGLGPTAPRYGSPMEGLGVGLDNSLFGNALFMSMLGGGEL